MLLKDSARSRILYSPRFNMSPAVDTIIKHLRLKNHVERIIKKTSTIVIITDGMVVRVPLDKVSAARCRLNKIMLEKLTKTTIASFAPRFLYVGKFADKVYYCEERLPGYAIDIPITRMDELVLRAADFITEFHQATACNIIIDETNFKKLFGREFKRSYPYLNDEYRAKAEQIEMLIKKQLLGKRFKTVWFHGDYNIENILFDIRTWQIEGIIDWDLSRRQGLPLLDLFYLLIYKDSLLSKDKVTAIFTDRFMKLNFNDIERKVITEYQNRIKISNELLTPMLVMFWVNHIVERYRQQLTDNSLQAGNWIRENLYNIIDVMEKHIDV